MTWGSFEDDARTLARELWVEAWPDVPFELASKEDVTLFYNHACSLLVYDGS